jgi:predicted nucleic acid-binding protein
VPVVLLKRLVIWCGRRYGAANLWSLGANVSAYDACYAALAQVLRCPLVTGDARLARAPGLGITTLVV